MNRAEWFVAIASGALFGAGLVISGMASPEKVLGFLTLGPGWDPSLAVVMTAALAITLPGFAWLRRRGRPLWADQLAQPINTRVEHRLVIGALLFGAGWGLAGYCPGPAIVGAALGQTGALLFLPAMLAGGLLVAALTRS